MAKSLPRQRNGGNKALIECWKSCIGFIEMMVRKGEKKKKSMTEECTGWNYSHYNEQNIIHSQASDGTRRL